MQTILLIRHADARSRDKWRKPDHLRQLTEIGRRQADRIAEEFGGLDFADIRTSPLLRCVQTVEPLARRRRMTIKKDPLLGEGSLFNLPNRETSGVFALCAHGDNIPALLHLLGLNSRQCGKGSVWILKRNSAGKVTSTKYLKPNPPKPRRD